MTLKCGALVCWRRAGAVRWWAAVESSATVEIVIEDEHAMFGVAGSQASQNRSMTTLWAFDAQPVVIKQLMQHLGKTLVLFQRPNDQP